MPSSPLPSGRRRPGSRLTMLVLLVAAGVASRLSVDAGYGTHAGHVTVRARHAQRVAKVQ